jgi:hypothetical protein
MSILSRLMSEARKAELGFGIHSNCIISSVTNEERRNKDNEVVRRNCFITFQHLNDEKKVVAEKEISWFNLDYSQEPNKIFNSFFDQLKQLTAIADCFIDPKGRKNLWDKGFEDIVDSFKIEIPEDPETPLAKQNLKEDLMDLFKSKEKGMKFMKELTDFFTELMQEALTQTKEEPVLLRLKLVTDNKGKYIQIPRFSTFVEPMSVDPEKSSLKITQTELNYKEQTQAITNISNATTNI